jgi:hypothetical protein
MYYNKQILESDDKVKTVLKILIDERGKHSTKQS